MAVKARGAMTESCAYLFGPFDGFLLIQRALLPLRHHLFLCLQSVFNFSASIAASRNSNRVETIENTDRTGANGELSRLLSSTAAGLSVQGSIFCCLIDYFACIDHGEEAMMPEVMPEERNPEFEACTLAPPVQARTAGQARLRGADQCAYCLSITGQGQYTAICPAPSLF